MFELHQENQRSRKSVLIIWLRLLGRTEVKLKLIEQTAGTFGKV